MLFPTLFSIRIYSRIVSLILAVMLITGPQGWAQLPTIKPETTFSAGAVDSLGRQTPRGTVQGFIKAVGNENYARAALYLDLPVRMSAKNRRTGPQLAQALQQLLDQQGSLVPESLISNDSTGKNSDKLGPDLDQVGEATVDGQTIPILLERKSIPGRDRLWRFSVQTVQQIPAQSALMEQSVVNRFLPKYLIEKKWGGVPVGHWFVMLVLLMASYILARLLVTLASWLLRIFWYKARKEQMTQLIQAFVPPVRLFLTVVLFTAASGAIGVSIVVRQSFGEIIIVIGLVAFLLLMWRLVDVFSKYAQVRLLESGQAGRLSAVLFLRRGIKLVLIAFGSISVLNVFGWDVTTGLAALGIGGLALALGAQKTIENFVGSITIIADQPLRVGDFCKVDGMAGTVEQIGIRSTRLRTPSRTIVVIPNGQLAALKIENFAFRDRMLFNPTLGLRYETTPDQIRYLLAQLRSLLQNHPQVNPNPARVRFTGLGDNSLNVEVFAYVDTVDFNEFLAVQEDLVLRMLDILDESGAGIAFPSQTVYVGADSTQSAEKIKRAEEKGRELRVKDEQNRADADAPKNA